MASKKNNTASQPFLARVEKTIASHQMLDPGDAVLVGVSGGPDSVALLHALQMLGPSLSIKLGVAHLDHGLRPGDSEKDARFVSLLSERLDLPCYLKKEDVGRHHRKTGKSLEEAGREKRYGFFRDIAKAHGYAKIATGHTADDNAEVILMNLLRGSGMTGLSGIPPVRENTIVRPLIQTHRADILHFLSEKKIDYVLDATNQDTRFLRNRVRHCLIPELASDYNPDITSALTRLGEIMREDNAWIDALAEKKAAAVTIEDGDRTIALSLARLQEAPEGLKKRVIRKAIQRIKGNLRRISYDHITAVLDLMAGTVPGGAIHLPDQVLVQREKDRVRFSKKGRPLRSGKSRSPENESLSFEYTVFPEGFTTNAGFEDDFRTVHIAETGARIRFSQPDVDTLTDLSQGGQAVAFFDMDRIRFPMVIRNFRPGDRFLPLGMTGTQKVKTWFINNKIPASERKKCPILLSQGNIIWLAGFRQGALARVTPETRTIFKAEYLPA